MKGNLYLILSLCSFFVIIKIETHSLKNNNLNKEKNNNKGRIKIRKIQVKLIFIYVEYRLIMTRT